jgi:hypothetical protein
MPDAVRPRFQQFTNTAHCSKADVGTAIYANTGHSLVESGWAAHQA